VQGVDLSSWICVAAVLACIGPAYAADPARAGAGDDDDVSAVTSAAGKLLAPQPVREWSAELGLRTRVTSQQGRRDSAEAFVGLTFDIVWRDLIFLSSNRGLGVNTFKTTNLLLDGDKFKTGFSVNLDDVDSTERSRSQSRSLDFRNRNTMFALGFAEYQIGRWTLWSELAHYLAGDNGNVLSVGAEYRMPLTGKWSVATALGISAADHAYMKENYAVPPIFTLAKAPLFVQPKAGFRDLTVSVDFEYQADEHWRLNTVVGFTQSLAVIQKGAWVKVQSLPFISTGLRYKF
jgi:outer membrane scaffolding protein for murein synthesis (MipA/OmpV family)